MDSGASGGEVRLRSVELEDANLQSGNMAKGDKNSPQVDNTNGELTASVKNGSKSREKDLERANNNEDEDECSDDSFVGHWKLFTRVLKSKRFESEKLESLYQRYIFRLNQKFTSWLVTILIILCLSLVGFQFSMEGDDRSKNIEGYIMLAFTVIYMILAVIVNRNGSSDKQMSDSSQKQLRWVSYALLVLSCGFVLSSVLCPIGSDSNSKYDMYYSPTDGVWVTIFFIYMTYTMLPVRMRIAVFGGCVLLTLHLVSSAFQNSNNENLSRLLLANLFLFICANLTGVFTHYPTEISQRQAFMETRRCIESRLISQKENQNQERLLLSVLPRYVAMEMKDDIESGQSENMQFHKIYIQRHENVSILFADIEGFTVLSSMCTAQNLIKTLNELYARFDQLAVVLPESDANQGRVKGLVKPGESSLKGLVITRGGYKGLVTNQGRVLPERFGDITRGGYSLKGQYDVWSNDVTIANHMESGGPCLGRVHITRDVLNCLNGDYVVEEGNGRDRDSFLKQYNIQTYLVVANDPVKVCFLIHKEKKHSKNQPEKRTKTRRSKTAFALCRLGINKVEQDTEDEVNNFLARSIDARSIERLRKDFVKPLVLTFKDEEKETLYSQERDHMFKFYTSCVFLIFVFILVVQVIILPRNTITLAVFVTAFLAVLALYLLIIAEKFMSFPNCMKNLSTKICNSRVICHIIASVLILILYLAAIGGMFGCEQAEKLEAYTIIVDNVTKSMCNANHTPLHPDNPSCDYPQYFTFSVVLAMIACAVFLQLSTLQKLCLLSVMAGTYILLVQLYTVVKDQFARHDSIQYCPLNDFIQWAHLSSLIVLMFICALTGHGYLHEQIARLDFLWKLQATEEKKDMEQLQEYNKKLLYNILPVHVAQHFLGQKSKKNEDLYYQSCDKVAVMFSNICNFSEFYSELDANGEGVECLRLLNEILADFDELLSEPQFQCIEKIKTIGETYMAASGIKLESQVTLFLGVFGFHQSYEKLATLNHVVLMADFAMAMKQKLCDINIHSFNNFQMKVGLNFGPVVAGVIGAHKPQYDIWGDTVNVASRMYSTGKADSIQVTKSIYDILSTRGYTFNCRGLVAVKGKGKMVTYWLTGKEGSGP
ncbi:hypothetical protein QZH41_017759 [Actinostola sp. cb2023]|nr:hypothetical protein QZH41_017759 [Actinostola sp. cb2023]